MENDNYYEKWAERRKEARDRERNRIKLERDNIDTINQCKDIDVLEFVCSNCKKEYSANSRKHIGKLGGKLTAWYVGKCPCGSYNLRRITDKKGDTFFLKSNTVKRMRVDNFNDTLDFTHPLFKVIYPKQYRELEEKRLKQYGN